MLTAIDIPDGMYRRLQARATAEARSVSALILHAIEESLKPETTPRGPRVRLPLVHAKKPGTLRLDNARIYDVISFP